MPHQEADGTVHLKGRVLTNDHKDYFHCFKLPKNSMYVNSDDQGYNCFHFPRARLGKEETLIYES